MIRRKSSLVVACAASCLFLLQGCAGPSPGTDYQVMVGHGDDDRIFQGTLERLDRQWRPRHWSYFNHPKGSNFWYEPHGDGVRFCIEDPNVVQVWTMRFSPAIKVAARPILIVRYRAQNTDPGPGWYMLWIDDGTGPDRGGFAAISLSEIQGDGQVHEIRRDLRTFNPQGDLFYFAVGVASGPKGSAKFDLFEIRFEPDNGSLSD